MELIGLRVSQGPDHVGREVIAKGRGIEKAQGKFAVLDVFVGDILPACFRVECSRSGALGRGSVIVEGDCLVQRDAVLPRDAIEGAGYLVDRSLFRLIGFFLGHGFPSGGIIPPENEPKRVCSAPMSRSRLPLTSSPLPLRGEGAEWQSDPDFTKTWLARQVGFGRLAVPLLPSVGEGPGM